LRCPQIIDWDAIGVERFNAAIQKPSAARVGVGEEGEHHCFMIAREEHRLGRKRLVGENAQNASRIGPPVDIVAQEYRHGVHFGPTPTMGSYQIPNFAQKIRSTVDVADHVHALAVRDSWALPSRGEPENPSQNVRESHLIRNSDRYRRRGEYTREPPELLRALLGRSRSLGIVCDSLLRSEVERDS
jgi:hypothetical protein